MGVDCHRGDGLGGAAWFTGSAPLYVQHADQGGGCVSAGGGSSSFIMDNDYIQALTATACPAGSATVSTVLLPATERGAASC